MRVYIASQYMKKEELNRKIYDELRDAGMDAFLPISIDIDATAECPEEQRKVADICYDEIERCDVILAVWDFGRSVSAELGYAICMKTRLQENKKIIIFAAAGSNTIMDSPKMDIIRGEVMIWPFVDQQVASIEELMEYLRSIQ